MEEKSKNKSTFAEILIRVLSRKERGIIQAVAASPSRFRAVDENGKRVLEVQAEPLTEVVLGKAIFRGAVSDLFNRKLLVVLAID